MITRSLKLISVAVTALVAVFILSAAPSEQTSALSSGSDFKAGNIIDDYVFYNKDSMSSSQIQSFLNSKVPICDTDGSQPASDFGRSDLTRAEYAAMEGWHEPPYTCLKNYEQDTPQMEAASGLCEGLSAKSNRSAANIIKDVAMACGINPQVLLVLLNKEQSLVTDTWPLNIQYQSATGFDCPDTAPCDPAYSGFFYQVYHAARQFKVYKAYPNDYNYIAGRTNRIYWYPDLSRCGSSDVYIENQATAALYIYTPYRPNSAALNNLYGTGDSCSSYGNRNFWRMFTDWFGSTRGGITVSDLSFETQPFTDKQGFVKFTIRNLAKSPRDLGRIKVEARGENSSYYQTASVNDLTVNAGQTYTFRQPITITEEGDITFSVARYANNAWQSPPFGDFTITDDTSKTFRVTAEPTIDQSLSLTEGNQHLNAPITATFRIKNNSTTQAVNVGRLKVQGSLNGAQYDFPSTLHNLTIPAGQTYTYNEQFTPTKMGTYTFKIVNHRSDYGWSANFPANEASSIVRTGSVTVKDSVTVTEPLSLSSSSTHQGQAVTATFTMRNFSDDPVNIGRMKVQGEVNGTQRDFPSTPYDLTLQPGEEYVYNESRSFAQNGTYNFELMNHRSWAGWSTEYPEAETSSVSRAATLTVKDSVTVTEPLSLSSSSTHQGQAVTATFTMRNFSSNPVNIGRMKVQGEADGTQYDFPSTPYDLTLQPGEEYVYNESRSFAQNGTYNFELMNHRSWAGWSTRYPMSEFVNIGRTAKLAVRDPVTVTKGLSLSSTSARQGQAVTATFTMRNFSSNPVNIGRMKVQGEADGTQYDFPSTPYDLTLQPGEEYVYNESRELPVAGNYAFGLMNHRSWAGWSANFPINENSDVTRNVNVTAQSAVTVTSGLSLSADTVSTGEPVTATFTMRNFSDDPVNIGRMKVQGEVNGTQRDFPSTPYDLTLQPGEEYVYNESRSFAQNGTYNFELMNHRSWAGWSTEYPEAETSSVSRAATLTVQ